MSPVGSLNIVMIAILILQLYCISKGLLSRALGPGGEIIVLVDNVCVFVLVSRHLGLGCL